MLFCLSSCNKKPISKKEHSIYWQKNSAEYVALSYQAFNIAKLRLDKNVKAFIKDLGKDGLKNESNELSALYKKHIIEFNVKFQQFKRKNK